MVKAHARVTLELEIPLDRPWDGTDTMERIRTQASAEAEEKLQLVLQGNVNAARGIKVMGVSKLAVLITEDKNP